MDLEMQSLARKYFSSMGVLSYFYFLTINVERLENSTIGDWFLEKHQLANKSSGLGFESDYVQ
jgi:hypothetical protein